MTTEDTPIASITGARAYSPRIYSAIAAVTLALPFIIGTIALHGLHDHIVTFHGSDEEINQYPIIMRFVESFPKMMLWDYDLRQRLYLMLFLQFWRNSSAPLFPSLEL